MSKNREPSFPDPEQPGKIEELRDSSGAGISVEHPDLINWRRAHGIKKAIKVADDLAPDLEIPDEADASDLTSHDLELVNRVTEEVDRITDSEENPQKK